MTTIQQPTNVSAAAYATEPNFGVKGLRSRARTGSDAYHTFENPQDTDKEKIESSDAKQIWGSEDDETLTRKHESWKRLRQKEKEENLQTVQLKHLILTALSLYAFQKASTALGFSARKVGVPMLILALLRGLYVNRAPTRTFPLHPEDYPVLPIFGQVGAVREGLKNGFAAMQVVRGKKMNFQTSEFVLFGGVKDILLMDPRDREYFLKTNWKNYVKNGTDGAGFAESFFLVLGRGIFAIDGEEWQDHRKVASHLFSANGLKAKMEKSFASHSDQLVELLRPKANTDATLDFQDVLSSLTFETICDIAFGVEPGSLKDCIDTGRKIEFLAQFDRVQQLCVLRLILPRPIWKFMRFFNIGFERQLRKDAEGLTKYIMDIIHNRRNSSEGFESADDLLAMYVRTGKASGKPYMLDDDYLFDAVLNFMLAGRDTTSYTLTNVFKLLGTHPEAEAKLLEELDRVVGKGNAVTWDHVRELRYCGAVFNEVLRLYPPVGGDVRIALTDDILPSGVHIQAGQRVSIPNKGIGRDHHLWESPDEFIPERWMQEGKPTRRPDEYVYPVFWGGPRLCLGKDMARLEVISITYKVLSDYKVKVLPHSEKMMNAPVTFYEFGLPVQILRRE